MPRLMRIDTDVELGTISEAHQAFLIANLQDETDDTEFEITPETLELLSDNDADPALLDMLEKGLDGDEEMTIAFEA